jgi:hypothetical protein
MMISAETELELRDWSRRNALVREIYYMEQTLAAQKSTNITKTPCMVGSCEKMTAAKSGLCRPHQKTVKYL